MEDVKMISVYFLKLLCIVAEMSGVGEKNASSQRKISTIKTSQTR